MRSWDLAKGLMGNNSFIVFMITKIFSNILWGLSQSLARESTLFDLFNPILMKYNIIILGLLGDNWTNNKICLLCDSGLSHIITAWSCWMLGNIVVPLPVNSSQEEYKLI